MLNLHIIQALYGDCILIEYGAPDAPQLMLVDGGPPTNYGDHLRQVLVDFAARGCRLDHVVLTHSDDDHVVGLVDLFTDTRRLQAQGAQPAIPIDAVWMNSFAFDARVAPSLTTIAPIATATPPQPDASGRFPDLGYADAIDLRTLVGQLGVALNPEFGGGVVSAESAPPALTLDNVTLRMVGPDTSNLARMKKEWDAYVASLPPDAPEVYIPEVVPDKVSPDQSIPNRSSIMFVIDAGGERALLTGDGRASDILRGLERSGLLPKGGTLHVDLFKVPHHGSARNNSRRLFERVSAGTYVISANGRDGNPDYPTLVWIVRTAHSHGRRPLILATNPTPTLERLVQSHPPHAWGYTLEIMPAGKQLVTVNLE